MCFYERPSFRKLIVHNLKTQSFVQKYPGQVEFVIADDSVEEYKLDIDALRADLAGIIDDVTYVRLDHKLTIGEKRNMLCRTAKHGVLIFMDDDDYYFPTYVEYSVTELYKRRKALVGSNAMLFCYTHLDFKKLSINCISPRQIHEATMCMLKSHWEQTGGFQSKGNGEGARLIDGHETKVNAKLDINKLMVCICHRRNTCNKAMFVNLGQPAEYVFDDSLKALVTECIQDEKFNARLRFCFKYPSRSRPEQFKQTFDRYVEYLSGKHDYHFVVSMDQDDQSMNNPEIIEYLTNMRRRYQLEYYYGEPKTKVDAINRDMIAPAFDILVLISDDMIPQVKGFDEIIADTFAEKFPDFDGMLNFNDGLRNDWPKLCTLTIYGYKYYQRFGYIYHPDYQSLYCDDEQTQVGRLLNKIADIDRVIIRHEWNDERFQDMLRTSTEKPELYAKDLATFEKRKVREFDYNKPATVSSTGVSPSPGASTAKVTVYVVAHDVQLLGNLVKNVVEELGSTPEFTVQAHFRPSMDVYGFEKLHELVSSVTTSYVTFRFPGESYDPEFTKTVLSSLTESIDVLTFKQRCTLDGGASTFIVRSDAASFNEPISLQGPWKQEYQRSVCNWSVFKTSVWKQTKSAPTAETFLKDFLAQMKNCLTVDGTLVHYGFK